MSRNNKSARLVAQRKKNTAQRAAGGGPAKTQPQHGKKNAWWQKFPSYSAWIAGANRQRPAEA